MKKNRGKSWDFPKSGVKIWKSWFWLKISTFSIFESSRKKVQQKSDFKFFIFLIFFLIFFFKVEIFFKVQLRCRNSRSFDLWGFQDDSGTPSGHTDTFCTCQPQRSMSETNGFVTFSHEISGIDFRENWYEKLENIKKTWMSKF